MSVEDIGRRGLPIWPSLARFSAPWKCMKASGGVICLLLAEHFQNFHIENADPEGRFLDPWKCRKASRFSVLFLRTDQNTPGQTRTAQTRTDQNRPEQARTDQNKPEQTNYINKNMLLGSPLLSAPLNARVLGRRSRGSIRTNPLVW